MRSKVGTSRVRGSARGCANPSSSGASVTGSSEYSSSSGTSPTRASVVGATRRGIGEHAIRLVDAIAKLLGFFGAEERVGRERVAFVGGGEHSIGALDLVGRRIGLHLEHVVVIQLVFVSHAVGRRAAKPA